MAEKRTINIDINSNASEAEKDFKSFNKAVDETTKSAKNLDATFEEVYGELQPLTTRMGEAEDRLYELALAGDTASKEYQELLTKVGEYRKVQIQTDLAVDGAATTIGQKLGSALTGATSGFAATQGAMALFGSENDALEKSLLKVQSALAIQQGVDGLRTSYKELGGKTGIATKAQAAFNFVMNLNPIILIVTGITLAIGALLKFTSVLDPVIQKLKNFGDAIGLTNFAEENMAEKREERAVANEKRLEKEIENLKEIRANLDKNYQAYQKQLNAEIVALKQSKESLKNKEEIAAIDEQIRAKTIEGIEEEYKTFKEGEQLKLDGYEKEIKRNQARIDAAKARGSSAYKTELFYVQKYTAEANKLRKELNTNNFTQYQEYINKLEAVDIEKAKKEKEEQKASNDRYKQYLQDRLSIRRQIEDIENGLLQDGIEKELEINRDKFRRLREDAEKNTKLTKTERARLIELFDEQELAQQKVINKKYVDLEKEKNAKIDEERDKLNQDRIDKEDALFQLELDLMKDRQMAEIIALSQSYEAKYLLAQDNAELTKQLEAQFLIDQAAIEDQFRKEKADKEKAASDKSIADAQAIQDFKFDIASQGLQTISNLSELFAGKSEKAAKKAFQVQKAVSIAQATIDTYKSANAIFASTAANPITVLNPSAPFIAAGVAVAAGLVNVATIASQQFQGGGSNGGGGQESAPDLGGGATPNFNVVGDSGINQIAQLQQQPVQAFVVSGEVTTSQALDRNRVQNATL